MKLSKLLSFSLNLKSLLSENVIIFSYDLFLFILLFP